jgi:type VI secretion system secreted protein Hcp
MAFQPYMSVKGARQGQFKGEALQQQRKDKWIPVLALNMSLKSPHDAATGQPSGKRQYEPVAIVKEWGAASPQGLTACATNENLTEL